MVRKWIVRFKIILLNTDFLTLKNTPNISISANELLKAYTLGYFPMADSRNDKNLVFIDPEYRALIPIEKFHISKRLDS